MAHNNLASTRANNPASMSSYDSFDTPSFKFINDPIHGHIRLDDYIVATIDTEQFQRLRNIKQLGSAYYVFPGASHNRFEHSIGVSHLAGELIERFQREQPSLRITDSEVKCVKLAGLCHDLGHGPFSHVFDNEFVRQALGPERKWKHEEASVMMLQAIFDKNKMGLEDEEIRLIKDLISGGEDDMKYKGERGFLYDIVANKRNSVDVDKFDYLQRDCQNLAISSTYDADRLMKYSRVIDGQICYYHKEVYNLYEMFHTRYSLFKRIYTHRVGKAIEYQITDALLAADSYLGISAAIDDPEKYLHLTDDILFRIECSTCNELAPARKILKDLRTRKLYRFVDEFLIPSGMKGHLTKEKINSEAIIEYQGDNVRLNENDIIVEWLNINYAMKEQNPVDHIQFYNNKYHEDTSFNIKKGQVSYLVPEQFEEIVIRVFTREESKGRDIQNAFRRLMKTFEPLPMPSTPNSNIFDPNEGLTIPKNFESPRKKKFPSSPTPMGIEDPLNHSRINR